MTSSLRLPIKIIQIIALLFVSTSAFLHAQDPNKDDFNILEKYGAYNDAFREVAYIHLNKALYIKGEDIGFTAYILNKDDKKPSQITTNLYVVIEDDNNHILKSKLLRVENGVASNSFDIDSTFVSGHYKLKAYTNWMRNFKENNHFVESIRIIDPETETYIEKEQIEHTIDAQFLPEGGYLVHDVISKVGVILKDTKGYGISLAKGEVLNNKGQVITTFSVNQFGIGQFILLAQKDHNYQIKINHNNKDFSFNLNEKIEEKGISLSLSQLNDKAIVSIKTNAESMDYLKHKPFKLVLHNGKQIQLIDIAFNKEQSITKVFNLEDLPPGINIFTILNENDQPVVERLFFNYNGIDIIKSDHISAKKSNDSLSLQINFKAINPKQFNSLSVSVLPQETKSYNRHHNLISYNFLQPYINGAVENAKYYFTNVTALKQLELDNLLITQGWSSYDWSHMFRANTNSIFPFEQGLTLKANINSKQRNASTSYILHAIPNQQSYVVELSENDTTFLLENAYFSENDEVLFSQINKKNKLIPANLYVQSFPSAVPNMKDFKSVLKPKTEYNIKSDEKDIIIFDKKERIQELDEVIVKAKLNDERTRIEKLQRGVFGRIHVFNEIDRQRYTLRNYINAKTSFTANESAEEGLVVTNRMPTTINANAGVLIYLNDVALNNNFLLYNFSMHNVDYIEVNNSGIGEGMRGGNGVLKIYTDPKITNFKISPTTKKYDLPLTFSAKKKFYVPKYKYYQNNFYEGYGTVDWKPELKTDPNGNVTLKIEQPKVPITLFIEGIANDGAFIFEEKTINLN